MIVVVIFLFLYFILCISQFNIGFCFPLIAIGSTAVFFFLVSTCFPCLACFSLYSYLPDLMSLSSLNWSADRSSVSSGLMEQPCEICTESLRVPIYLYICFFMNFAEGNRREFRI